MHCFGSVSLLGREYPCVCVCCKLLCNHVDLVCICWRDPLHVSVGIYGHGTMWLCATDVPLVFVWGRRGDLKQDRGRIRGRKEGLGPRKTSESRVEGVGGPGGSVPA